MLAVCIACLVTYTNTSTYWAHKMLSVAFVMKVVTMAAIIVGGVYWMAAKTTVHLQNPFEGMWVTN